MVAEIVMYKSCNEQHFLVRDIVRRYTLTMAGLITSEND
jgi:hypothetical protein